MHGISVDHHFSKTTHKGRSCLICNDIPNLEVRLSDQILLFTGKRLLSRFILNDVELRRTVLWEQAISNLSRRDLGPHHEIVVVHVDLIGEHVVEGVIEAGALRKTRGLLRLARAHICISFERRLGGGRVMRAVTALESNRFWGVANFLNLLVEKEVQVSGNQTFLRTRLTA